MAENEKDLNEFKEDAKNAAHKEVEEQQNKTDEQVDSLENDHSGQEQTKEDIQESFE